MQKNVKCKTSGKREVARSQRAKVEEEGEREREQGGGRGENRGRVKST